MSSLIIIGAGAEKTEGIDMPLCFELIPQINNFIKNTDEGQYVHSELKKIIKSLHFTYDGYVEKTTKDLAIKLKSQIAQAITELNNLPEDLSDEELKIKRILKTFLEKIYSLRSNSEIDEDTIQLIEEICQIDVTDEHILDLRKVTFTSTFEQVMQRLIRIGLENPEHRVLKCIITNFFDFELLLLENFLGFYTDNPTEIKKYLYISWTFWAFLVWKEKEVFEEYELNRLPFYSKIAHFDNVITFNYTSFTKSVFEGRPFKYFHGCLDKFIDIKFRQQVSIDNYSQLNFMTLFNNFKEVLRENIKFEPDEKRYIIPSIVPPFKIKPVLSNEYIDVWYSSSELIRTSEKIVIVGYSFSDADGHFNDIIRKNSNKKFYIILPHAEKALLKLENIFSYSSRSYLTTRIQDKTAFTHMNLTVISAKADEIDYQALLH